MPNWISVLESLYVYIYYTVKGELCSRRRVIFRQTTKYINWQLKVKVKCLWGAFWPNWSFSWLYFLCTWCHALALCHWAPHSLYLLGSSTLTDITENPSEMRPLKLTDFCLFSYHQSYKILQGPHILPNGFHKLSWPGLVSASSRWELALWPQNQSDLL